MTVDMLMEGVDFRFPDADPRAVGRKALAVYLSDIAAMAGRPLAAVVSVALPKTGRPRTGRRHHAGIEIACRRIQRGDCRRRYEFVGRPARAQRHAAGTADRERPGSPQRRTGGRLDHGDGRFRRQHQRQAPLIQPRVDEALALHQAVHLHAMIDVSDGLAADLYHILDESGMGAVVRAGRAIPTSEAARRLAGDKIAARACPRRRRGFRAAFHRLRGRRPTIAGSGPRSTRP